MFALRDEVNEMSLEMWFRINSKDAVKNIVHVLSPHPVSPFPIPFGQFVKKIHEKGGTIEFRIKEVGNLFDRSLDPKPKK